MKKLIKFIVSVVILLSFHESAMASCWFSVPNAVCGGTNLAVTFQSGTTIHYVTGYSYSVSGNTININISGSSTGNHSVYIGYSCSGSWDVLEYYDSFWYGTPPVKAHNNETRCSGSPLNVQLEAEQSAPGLNFGWSSSVTSGSVSGNGSGLDAGGYITDVLTGSGVVTYTIYTKLNTCTSASKTFAVTVLAGSSAGSGITGPTSVCEGQSVTLTAGGSPSNFYWERRVTYGGPPGAWENYNGTNVVSRSVAMPSGASMVEFKIVANSSCASTSETNPFAINDIKPIPTISFYNLSGSSSTQAPVCSGGGIYASMTATTGSSINWTASVTSGSVTGVPSSGSASSSGSMYTMTSGMTVTSQSDATIQYNYSVTKNGCSSSIGAQSVTAYSLYLTGIPSSDITICSGENAGVSLTKATSGSISYTGTVISGTVTGTLTGTDTNINEALTNPGTIPAHVQYAVTLTNGGCSRVEYFDVYVNHIPDPGEIVVDKTSVCGADIVTLTIQDNSHAVYYQYSNATSGGWQNLGRSDEYPKVYYTVNENTDFRTALVTPLCGANASTLVKSVAQYADPELGLPDDKAYHQQSGSFTLEIDRITGYGYQIFDPANLTTPIFDSPPGQTDYQKTVSPGSSTHYRLHAYSDANATCVSTGYAALDANFFGGDVPLSDPIPAADSYVRSYTAGQAGLTESSTYSSPYQMSVATEYVDGLGRSLQTVQRQASPDEKDLIVPVEYDEFGRQVRNYLPYTNTNNTGSFDTDPYYNQHQYYQSPPTGVEGDLYSFGQTGYEKSPLNRVVETAAPGFSWYPGFDFNYTERKTARTNYRMNIESLDGTIIKWTNGAYASYGNNQLYVTESIDENGHIVREFQDKEGRTVLKRVQAKEDQTEWADTYYSYDNFGNLVTVLPPEASKLISTAYASAEPGFTVFGTNHSVTTLESNDQIGYAGGATITIGPGITLTPGFHAKASNATPPSTQSIDNWIFQYQYDNRNRMTHKKVPGAEWMYMVYDNRDRLVMTQDGNQRGAKQWSFTKYDQLNRPVMTGIYTHGLTVDQYTMQTTVNDFYTAAASNSDEWFEIAGSAIHGYTDQSFPKSVAANDYLTVTYYDSYSVSDTWGSNYAYEDLNLTGTFNSITYNQPDSRSTKTIGQVTAAMVKNLTDNTWLKSVNYYDEKYKVVQSLNETVKQKLIRTTNVYDFVGKILKSESANFEVVIWSDLVGVVNTTDGGIKSTSGSQWGMGAASSQMIQAGQDGSIEFTVTETNLSKVVGLNHHNPDAGNVNIDYYFYLYNSTLYIYENNVLKATSSGTLSPGEILKIQRIGTTIYYKRNGVTQYTSQSPSTTDLLVDVSMHLTNATVSPVKLFVSPSTITRTFDYDHTGRVLNTWHKVDSDATVLLAHNEYNKVGQLIDKKLHSEDSGTNFEQSVDYRYNIRGWLTSINNADLANDGTTNNDTGDLFGMNLLYEKEDNDLLNTIQLNGNISAMKWSANQGLADVKSHGYNYTYDPLNRIKGADFQKKTSGWSAANDFSVTGFNYDLNGNILALTRKNKTGENMDLLAYDYGSGNTLGNQLRSVTDTGDITKGFVDGNTSGDDYIYDANGNMTEDKNKDIAAIAYNHLNLPKQVTKGTGEYIKYIYDASGRKLSQEVYDATNTLTKSTDYAGEYIYENDTLRFINTEEGRVVLPLSSGEGAGGEVEYQYHLKDHLGNVRLTFTTKDEQEANTGTMETENATEEASQFLHYTDVRKVNSSLFDHTGLSATQYALRLNGTTNERIGLAKSLAVVPGDTVRLEVYAKYVDPVNNNWTQAMADLLNAVANGTAPAGTVIDGAGYAGGGSNNFPYGGSLSKSGETGSAPKAYLNYLVFDKDFVPDMAKSGFKRMTEVAKEDGTGVTHEKLDWEIDITQAGYVYIWLSNDQIELGGDPVEVYFDDFKVTHVKSPVVQSEEYYPFGLTFNSYRRSYSTAQNYLFNSMELQPETGWLDFGPRMYMSDIGRWGVIDPLSDAQEDYSPYHFSYNNPILYNDPTGMIGENVNDGGSGLATWVHNTETDEYLWIDDGYYFTFDVSNDEFEAIKEAGSIKEAGGSVYNRWFWRAVLEDLRGNPGKNEVDQFIQDWYIGIWADAAIGIYEGNVSEAALRIGAGKLKKLQKLARWARNKKNRTTKVPGTAEGGKKWANDGREGGQVLPRKTADGKPITYTKYDINPKPQHGAGRGKERMVVGTDGKAYYTRDHYKTFTEIK